MPYTLTPIQEEAFSQTFTLYKPVRNSVRAGTTKTMSGVYYSSAYTNVRGRIGQTPAVATPGRLGRTDEYMVYTFDVLRIHIDQECDDGWYVYHPAGDQWYVIQGTAQARHFRAQESTFKCARAEAPPMSANLSMSLGIPQ